MLTGRPDGLFKLILYVSVVSVLILHLIQPSCTSSIYVGEYHYRDLMTFLRSGLSCRFIPSNILSNVIKDQTKNEDLCITFMTTVENISAWSQIWKVQVQYFVFDKQYNYETKHSCASDRHLQNIGMMLICRQKTGVNGTTCDKNSTCERKGEVCQKYMDMDQQFCISVRHLYQSCDKYSPCDRNSECQISGSTEICQCSDNYTDINGRCVKSKLSLGEICTFDEQCSATNASQCLYNSIKNNKVCSCVKGYIASATRCIPDGLILHKPCEDNQQCTGTENANKCTSYGNQSQSTCRCNNGYLEKNFKCYETNRGLYESCDLSVQCTKSIGANKCKVVNGEKICFCSEDREDFEGQCLKSGLVLGDNCYINGQCTGTQNSGVCMADQTNNNRLMCRCKTGFIRYADSCLQANRKLYEACEISDQCNGTSGKGVCTEVLERKLCMCSTGYVQDKKTLSCHKANRNKDQKCLRNEQCNGTENANTCRLVRGIGICSCNDGFDWIDGKCLKIGRKLFETCINYQQCNGTDNARHCTNLNENDNKLCFCQDGYLDFKGRCVKASKKFNETCEIHQQCTGTENANLCRHTVDSSKCSCNHRFDLIDGKCLQMERKLFDSCINYEQCNGTYNARNCTDINADNNTVCFCEDGYLEYKGRCIQADRKLHEHCIMHQQCTGTDNANSCHFGDGVCSCNNRYKEIDGKCFQVGMNLFESCLYHEQCNGTENAGNCTDIRNNTVCFCEDNYLHFKKRCIEDKRNLDDMCEINLQCTGTVNAGVCGKNQTCICDEGFIRSKEGCLPEKDELLLVIAIGGFFGIMTCSLTTLFALKRRNSNTKRLECRSSSHLPVRNIRYSIVDNSACGSTAQTTAENPQSSNNTENIYDEAYQRQEQGTENVYSSSEPHFYHGAQNSDNDIYNHLHQKPIHMSEAIYGVPKSMSESMCSRMQEHEL